MDDSESCKVVLLGESGVGKTSIITQFTEETFSEEQQSTSGATFSSKEISCLGGKKNLKFEIWDTAGQEKYRALSKMFYKDAAAAVLVYDITRKASFEEIKNYWANEIKEYSPKKIVLAIAANKSDLFEKEEVDKSAELFSFRILMAESVATAIDALSVCIAFPTLPLNPYLSCFIICMCTFIICLAGHGLGKKLGMLLKDKALAFGGVILILIGLKTLVEHLGLF